jgi:hypothetical protein
MHGCMAVRALCSARCVRLKLARSSLSRPPRAGAAGGRVAGRRAAGLAYGLNCCESLSSSSLLLPRAPAAAYLRHAWLAASLWCVLPLCRLSACLLWPFCCR